MYKVEAPKEFDGVGSALSTIRREKAESGIPHMTARRLGALFETLLPSTPNLTRCYGQRASEISQEAALTPQVRKKYGMFSGQIGSDVTSIWAAATSGSAAIAVHLLACLLARTFDGPEATSIWIEIVHRRRENIEAEFDRKNCIDLATLHAAKQEITRAQLAEWDDSARSWLRTADALKRRQYKQLMLIIDNVGCTVNNLPNTFESVMEAWKVCLEKMEGLITGTSQQASHGDILLAVSAWHLFPDMMVVKPSATHVSQHDPIFASGGVLTVGLEPSVERKPGVHWSLPL